LRGVQPDASFKKFSGLKQQIAGNLLTKSILRIMMMQTAIESGGNGMVRSMTKRFTGFVALNYYYGWDFLRCPVNRQ